MPDPPEYVLVVDGAAVPWSKGAPPGKGPQVPDRQARYAGEVRAAWRAQHGENKEVWLEKGQPIRVVGHFYFCRPKDQYGTGANEKKPHSYDYAKPALAYPTGKPDLSNLLKMTEDALTGLVWRDDDQVVDITGSKRLVHWWEHPRALIKITPLPWITFEDLAAAHARRR